MQLARIGRRLAMRPLRGPLAGAVFAGALAGALTGMPGPASAQYYDEVEVYGYAPAYGRGFVSRDFYGRAARARRGASPGLRPAMSDLPRSSGPSGVRARPSSMAAALMAAACG